MVMRPSWKPAPAAGLAVVLGLCCIAAPPLVADDPMPDILNEASTPWTLFTLYTVNIDAEFDFLDALVLSGPYEGETPGFATEKIVRGETDRGDGTVTYLTITRHFDPRAMDVAEEGRRKAVAPYLEGEPFDVRGRTVEHIVPSWGLERSTEIQTFRLAGRELRNDLNQYGRTLTFFKTGYTGQLSSFQVFEPGAELGKVRSEIARVRGLSGASILRDPESEAFVVYVEYFETPEGRLEGRLRMPSGTRGAGKLPTGHMAGVVVQNYKAR